MKKFLALILIFTLSCLSVAGVSAVGRETPSEETTIYFEVPENWPTHKAVFCHIWPYGGDSKSSLALWQSKKERCSTTKTPGVYSYDISKVGELKEGIMYCVIFSTDNGMQTYETLMSNKCYGDTLYCDGTSFPNPMDHTKISIAARWKNQSKDTYGPVFATTSLGAVVGDSLPPYVSTEELFVDYISDEQRILTARFCTNKSDQELIDGLAFLLNIPKEATQHLMAKTDVYIRWNVEDSSIPSTFLGDANNDGNISVKDATAIQKHLAGYTVHIDTDAADSDTNLTVNIKDSTIIQEYLAGFEVTARIGKLFNNSYTLLACTNKNSQ